MKSVNGVTGLQSGASIVKPVINGLQGNRILILSNGVRLEGQQWGSEHAPEVDPFLATQITVLKGASGVRYGSDALGGVVLLDPPPLRGKPGLGGEVNLVGTSNNHGGTGSGFVEGSPEAWPGFAWRLQGTAHKVGETGTPEYFMNNTASEEYDYSAALGYQKEGRGLDLFYSRFDTKLGLCSCAELGNVSDLKLAIHRDRPLVDKPFSWDDTYAIANPYQTVDHQLFKVRGFTKTGELGNFGVTYAVQNDLRQEFDFHLSHDGLPDLLFNITSHTAEAVWEHNPILGLKGSVGLNGIFRGNYYRYREFIPNFVDVGSGIFWIESWKTGKLQWETGARYDYLWREVWKFQVQAGPDSILSPVFHYRNVSEMLGALYEFTPDFTLKANLASAWRAHGVNEMFSDGLHQGAAAVEIGDSALAPERSYDLTGELAYRYGKRLKLEVSAYYNLIRNYIYLKPDTQPTLTIRGAFPTFRYRQADATLRGVAAELHFQATDRWGYQGKASLLRGYNEDEGQYLFAMPADRFENALTFSFPESGRLGNAYVTAGMQIVLRQTYAPPAYLDYLPPPPGYSLINLSGGFTLSTGGRSVDIELGVKNLLDEAYREYTDRFRYFSDEMGRNIYVRLKMPFEFNGHKGE